jgi:hypothetical protein
MMRWGFPRRPKADRGQPVTNVRNTEFLLARVARRANRSALAKGRAYLSAGLHVALISASLPVKLPTP